MKRYHFAKRILQASFVGVSLILFLSSCEKTSSIEKDSSGKVSVSSFASAQPKEQVSAQMLEKMNNLQKIKSLSDLTEEMIVKNQVGFQVEEYKSISVKEGYGRSIKNLTGVVRYLRIHAEEPRDIKLLYHIKGDPDGLKVLLLTAGGEIRPLDPTKDSLEYVLPQGENFIVLAGYQGEGSLEMQIQGSKEVKTEELNDVLDFMQGKKP